jgi:hypothetical protein
VGRVSEDLLRLLIALPLIVMWILAMIEVIWRRNLSALPKLGWIGFLVFVPIISLAIYLIVRPPRSQSLLSSTSSTGEGSEMAASLVLLAEQRARGEVSDADYHTGVAIAIGAREVRSGAQR